MHSVFVIKDISMSPVGGIVPLGLRYTDGAFLSGLQGDAKIIQLTSRDTKIEVDGRTARKTQSLSEILEVNWEISRLEFNVQKGTRSKSNSSKRQSGDENWREQFSSRTLQSPDKSSRNEALIRLNS